MVIFVKKKIGKKNVKTEVKKVSSKKLIVHPHKMKVQKDSPTKHVELIKLKPKLEKLHIRHSGLTKFQKWVVGSLIVFVILIIIIAFLIPKSVYVPNTNTDLNITPDNNLVPDNNQSKDPNAVMTIEQFQNESLALQRSIYKDIMIAQKIVLEKYYSELGLNKNKMDVCISQNDFTKSDVNVENSKILMKIQKDTYLAPVIGVIEAPGIFVNGYYLPGTSNYSSLKTIIDFALIDTSINWDYSLKTYKTDVNAKATVAVIYNEDHKLIKDNTVEFIESLKNSAVLTPQVKNFFTSLFSEAGINYYNYTSIKGKQIIQTLDVQVIPVVYLEGDINSLTITKDKNFADLFNYLFIKTEAGGYILNQKILFDMLVQSNITNVHQVIDYTVINDKDDFVIGSSTPKVSVFIFTDYDCMPCAEFEKNNLDKLTTEYVNTNKIKIIKKDYVIHEMSALFPSIFARCAQEQNKYLEVNKKLFDLSGELGNNGLVISIMDKYKIEIDNLTNEYQKIVQSQKGLQ